MRKRILQPIKLVCIIFILLLVASFSHAAVIRTFPLNPIQQLGDVFTISVIGAGFPSTVGGDVQVDFDSSILKALGVTMTFPGDTNGSTIGADFVSLSAGDFSAPNPDGNFGIADIEFQAIGLGLSALTLSITSDWLDPNFSALDPQPSLVTSSVRVNVVPIPSAIFLLGGGLIGLIGLRRRRS